MTIIEEYLHESSPEVFIWLGFTWVEKFWNLHFNRVLKGHQYNIY